jgi:hypothetical protein
MQMRYENHRTLETLSGRVRLRLKIRRCERFDCNRCEHHTYEFYARAEMMGADPG